MQGGFCGEMGKAGRWLRSFLLGKKEKKAVDFSAVACSPALKEKRRWSFQRPAVAGKGLNSADLASPQLMRQLSESEIDKRRTMVITMAMAEAAGAAEGAAEAGRTSRTANWTIMELAAIKIQSIFRSYLARKALCALRGLVKLQAMVRGHLVRKQATLAFRCMQSLVMAQARARAYRMRMVKPTYDGSQRQPIHKTPHIQKSYTKEKNRNAEEDVEIVEMDHGEPSASLESRLAAYYYGVQEQYQQFTPAPSGFEEFPLTKQSSSPQHLSAASVSDATQASFGPSCPSYMANTESSRAKARSHSAPKQRPDLYERHLSSRRASAEGRSVSRGAKMQRSSSQASPRSIKLDQSSMTIKDSECDSTSTKLTSTNYCRSLVAYEVQI